LGVGAGAFTPARCPAHTIDVLSYGKLARLGPYSGVVSIGLVCTMEL